MLLSKQDYNEEESKPETRGAGGGQWEEWLQFTEETQNNLQRDIWELSQLRWAANSDPN